MNTLGCAFRADTGEMKCKLFVSIPLSPVVGFIKSPASLVKWKPRNSADNTPRKTGICGFDRFYGRARPRVFIVFNRL